jgi:hypothetical protein
MMIRGFFLVGIRTCGESKEELYTKQNDEEFQPKANALLTYVLQILSSFCSSLAEALLRQCSTSIYLLPVM